MSKINYDPKLRSDIAEAKPRDSEGHFVPESKQSSSPSSSSSPSRSLGEEGSKPSSSSKLAFLKSIFPTGTSFGKTEDENTLIDVHVNNPLKRIVELLQDIKRQKVFSFSVKGSLGIAGIALVLTGIGIFGGTQAFCTKGVQSHVGTIKALQFQEEVTQSSIPVLSPARNALSKAIAGGQIPLISQITQIVFSQQTVLRNRTILIKSDNSTIHLLSPKAYTLSSFINLPIIATGDYNSCSQTLTSKDPSNIELVK